MHCGPRNPWGHSQTLLARHLPPFSQGGSHTAVRNYQKNDRNQKSSRGLMNDNKTIMCSYIGNQELSETFPFVAGSAPSVQSRKSISVSYYHWQKQIHCCRSICILMSRCKQPASSSELVAYRGKDYPWQTDIVVLQIFLNRCRHPELSKSRNFGTEAYR